MARRNPNNKGAYTDFNLNYVYGCAKVDAEGGCKNCYINRYVHIQERLNLPNPFVGKAIPFNEEERLKELDSLRHNSVIFVNGLSDTFAEFITDEQRDRWLGHMVARPQYKFMLCTKRTGLMWLYFSKRKVPENVWVGTSICRVKDFFRFPILKRIDAKVRWISFEPLLEDLGKVDLSGISFITLGGETDPRRGYRPFHVEWGLSMLPQARQLGVPFWYDGGNGLNDSRRGAPSPEHRPNSGALPQERYEFKGCLCRECSQTLLTVF